MMLFLYTKSGDPKLLYALRTNMQIEILAKSKHPSIQTSTPDIGVDVPDLVIIDVLKG
jgi:hypothetical protein